MKILYMGTAAYDAIPSPFCNCVTCKRAFLKGGREIRTRTQALVNEDLLLDFNGDTVSHFLKYHIDSRKIKDCLITHSHCDHLCPDDICIPMYGTDPICVNYFAAKSGVDKIMARVNSCGAPERLKQRINVNEIFPGKEFITNGYRVLPLPANHDAKSSPVFYAIEKDNKRLLYALDSGRFFDEVFSLIKNFGMFDLITFDCTGGLASDNPWHGPHMKLEGNLEMLEKLNNIGVADSHTKVVITHFSHNGHSSYEDLVKAADKYGIIVAYDGLEIDF